MDLRGVITPASLGVMTPATLPAPLILGQRVTIYGPDTWINLREGTVVALPRPNGLLREERIAVEICGHTPFGPKPVRWMDPRRIAPLSTCETCSIGGGCYCDMRDPEAGCEHYGCWGPQAVSTCQGVASERARAAASNFARAAMYGAGR
jgi:hypothetical protein